MKEGIIKPIYEKEKNNNELFLKENTKRAKREQGAV